MAAGIQPYIGRAICTDFVELTAGIECMNCCVLQGSPRKDGNTEQLLNSFLAEWIVCGNTYKKIWLYEKQILPCIACRKCQQDWSVFGCQQRDDMQYIFDTILACDLILLATPIYSWYCTPPMKAMLDRLVYGMNKYYGERKGPALWEGKYLALLTTCGYPPGKGADLWTQGMQRYCKHSKLVFQGILAEHDHGYQSTFMTEEKALHARQFARFLSGKAEQSK